MATKTFKNVEDYAKSIFVDISAGTQRGLIVREEWDANSFTKGEIYKIESQSKQTLHRYTKYVVDMLKQDEFDQEFAYILLLMATHLHARGSEEEKFMLMPPAKGTTMIDLPALKRFEIWNQEEAVKNNKEKAKEGESKEDEDVLSVRKPSAPSSSTTEPAAAGSSISRATEYVCFYAAYLMRLCVRGIAQPSASYTNMRDRFKKFTGLEASQALKDPLSPGAIEELRRILSNDHMIARTWVRQFVPFHDTCSKNSDGDGMITYLAVLPFMYSGMHALKLFDEVAIESGIEDNILVRNLMHINTNKALSSMTHIYSKWYPRPGNAVGSSVKYARVIGPQYFPELQTKSCPLLVAMLANLLKLYKDSGPEATGGDVMKIEGLRNLSPVMKELAEETAKVIYENTHKTATYLYSGPVKKALDNIAAKNARNYGDSDGDDDDHEPESSSRQKKVFIK